MVNYLARNVKSVFTDWTGVVFGGLLLAFTHWSEPLYAPVIRDFEVKKVFFTPSYVYVSGTFHKARDCKFVGVLAEGITANKKAYGLPLLFQDSAEDQTNSRPTGPQKFGPWRMALPLGADFRSIRFTATHECHPLWVTKTVMGSANIYNLE